MNRERTERGMTAIEVVVALAIFSVLLLILTSLQIEFLRFEQRTDLELFDHPQRLAVIERVRADVQDAILYPSVYGEWVQSPSTLIVRLAEDHVVVWKFSAALAERMSWESDTLDATWQAREVPRFEISATEGPAERIGVRIKGFDDHERLLFDQIIFPRAD